jgi:hypothetical protein
MAEGFLIAPFELLAFEKEMSAPTSVLACGCTCTCVGSYCSNANISSNCGDEALEPFDNMSCQVHRADINKVLRSNQVAAMFMSCNGNIHYKK